MAIQMRRGLYQDFDPTKMLAGEWAIVTGGDPNTASGRAIYHAYAAGQVERVATYVDAAQIIINSIPDTVDALTQAVEAAEATRVLAEAARVQAEEARALAESGRASAETAREQKVITSATATADSGVGTPSVDVTLGQPSSLGRALAFAFHNIKGAKGDKGDKGDTVSVEPVTTSQIDTIAADGTVTSDLEALTATGLTYLWGKLKAAFAALTHTHTKSQITDFAHGHAAGDITSGTLAVARGGTNASDAAGARTNLGVPASSSIASVEQSTATASHATGSHFILDGILRKATSAIATGESITNSNSTTDTLQSQIDTLRDSVGNIKEMQAGSFQLTIPANSATGEIEFVYPNVFQNPITVIPFVQLRLWFSAYNKPTQIIRSSTVRGFNLSVVFADTSTTARTIDVNWLAISIG